MLKSKVVVYPLLIFSTVAILASGCAAKKPVPTPPAPARITPAPTVPPRTNTVLPPTTVPTPTPTYNSSTVRKMETDLSKIKDVRGARVVLSGNTATVGLDLKAKPSTARLNAIHKEAAAKVRKDDSRIKVVHVATDVPTTNRIKRIADEIIKGKPISTFTNDITAIQRRILPVR